ncbi:MAG: hypothetical protein JSW63_07040 [Ignavibacterium sp.]|nr:MAG: hypothetical protein JSW63_07040 [Ignavibacterium sp.]
MMIGTFWTKIKYFLPLVLGVVGGYLYYSFVGCNGTCPISGNLYISSAYGGLIGAIITDWKMIFRSLKKDENNKQI